MGILPPEDEFEAAIDLLVLLSLLLLEVLEPLGVLLSAAVHRVDAALVDALLFEVVDHLLEVGVIWACLHLCLLLARSAKSRASFAFGRSSYEVGVKVCGCAGLFFGCGIGNSRASLKPVVPADNC